LICGSNLQNNSQDFSSLVSEVSSTATLASQELDLMTLEDKFMQKVCIPGFINNFELFELCITNKGFYNTKRDFRPKH
jgi:hypothetical protein